MTGQERHQVTARLNQDLIDVVWLYDLNLKDGIGQSFPQVCDADLISNLQQLDVPEE